MSVYLAVNVLNRDTYLAIEFLRDSGKTVPAEIICMGEFIRLVSNWFGEINVKSSAQVKSGTNNCLNVYNMSEKIIEFDDRQKSRGFIGLAGPTREGLLFWVCIFIL